MSQDIVDSFFKVLALAQSQRKATALTAPAGRPVYEKGSLLASSAGLTSSRRFLDRIFSRLGKVSTMW